MDSAGKRILSAGHLGRLEGKTKQARCKWQLRALNTKLGLKRLSANATIVDPANVSRLSLFFIFERELREVYLAPSWSISERQATESALIFISNELSLARFRRPLFRGLKVSPAEEELGNKKKLFAGSPVRQAISREQEQSQ